jgi:hypothetical protein
MMEFIFSLPFLLAVALFIAIVILARILLSPEGALERRSRRDRRNASKVPQMPFYDRDRVLVTQDRRRREDRRKRSFVITTTQNRLYK